jgi:general secretion pathway protein F
MQFDVRALSPDNVMSRLVLDAQDEADARRQIEARGLFAASVQRASSSLLNAARGTGQGSRKISLVLFSQELLALLTAGLGIVEALEGLLERENNQALRSVLTRLLEGLREGKRFSAVLAEQSDLFPPLYIGIIKASEGTSDLPRTLSRFIDYQQRIEAVRSKIVSAAIYPSILLLVGGGVSFFLIAYVVPHFADVYRGAGRNLPWMSQLLLSWGRFSSTHLPTVLLIMALAAALAVLAVRQMLRGRSLMSWISRLPAIGERIRIHELSRLYLTLGMLVEGGIPIVTAMSMVEGMVSAQIRDSLQSTRSMVESGIPLSSALESNHLSTPISLRLLRVGERTGELGAMLSRSAAFYDGEISRWIDRFTRSFEPLLMAAIGVIVGVIVVSLYMPIFDLAGSIS